MLMVVRLGKKGTSCTVVFMPFWLAAGDRRHASDATSSTILAASGARHCAIWPCMAAAGPTGWELCRKAQRAGLDALQYARAAAQGHCGSLRLGAWSGTRRPGTVRTALRLGLQGGQAEGAMAAGRSQGK